MVDFLLQLSLIAVSCKGIHRGTPEDDQQCLSFGHLLSVNAALQDAEAEGCKTVSGLEMFVGQAAQQFELFTGQKAPIDLMRQATLDSMSLH